MEPINPVIMAHSVNSQGIAVIQTNLGIDNVPNHIPQSVDFDFITFNDSNFNARPKSLSQRLNAKIPKMFAWQLKPDYEYYLWLDGNIQLAHKNTVKYFLEQIQGYDMVVLRHPSRPNIRQEVRYTRKGINQQSLYMVSRYTGELLKELYEIIEKDKDYIDDLLVIGGIFMYRNTPQVQSVLKEWWYYNTRYILQDQISFPYVLKKSGLRVKVLEHDFAKWDFIKMNGHKTNSK